MPTTAADPRAPRVGWVLQLILIGLAANYFAWRTLGLWQWVGPHRWLSFLCLGWEIAMCRLALQQVWLLRRPSVSPAATGSTTTQSGSARPRIAILIPTFDEPAEVVERAIIGATSQEYPHTQVWVLDDGSRGSIEQLCQHYDVLYRSRSEARDGKAGNLNGALAELDPDIDYVAVFDADYVAQPKFLLRTLARMTDPRVALVQTPQYFFNRDLLQAAFPESVRLPDSLRFIYEVVLPAHDVRGAVPCCGTSFLARRSALDEVGGFGCDTVVEDLLTTQRLWEKGYRTKYLREALSWGLSPESLREYQGQQARWALGHGQMARRQLGSRGPLRQRLRGAAAFLRWPLTATLRLAFLAAVPWLLALDISPFGDRYPLVVAISGLLLVVTIKGTLIVVSRGTCLPMVSEAMHILPGLRVPLAALAGFSRAGKSAFVPTRKGLVRMRRQLDFGTIAALSVLLLATSLLLGARLADGTAHPLLCLASLYAIATEGLALLVAWERPERRSELRRTFEAKCVVFSNGSWRSASLKTCSSRAATIVPEVDLRNAATGHRDEADAQPSLIRLGSVGEVPISGTRRRGSELVVFLQPSHAQRVALIRQLYAVSTAPPQTTGSLGELLRGTLLRALEFVPRWSQVSTRPPRPHPKGAPA